MHLQKTTRPAAKQKAFTLIELLIVISIIALLASILMPSITAAIRSGYAAKSEAIVKSIYTALVQYHKAEYHYPGQRNSGDELPSGTTGSSLLAHALFTTFDENGVPQYPRTNYMSYKSDMLDTINGINDALVDGFPRPMAICYYYSRGKGDLSQFHYADNNEHTDDAGGSSNFNNAIKDIRYDSNSTTPYGDGGFLLIAPGSSREYFDGPDDKRAW